MTFSSSSYFGHVTETYCGGLDQLFLSRDSQVEFNSKKLWVELTFFRSIDETFFHLFPGGKEFLDRMLILDLKELYKSHHFAWAARAFDTAFPDSGLARNCLSKKVLSSMKMDLSLKNLLCKREHLMLVKKSEFSFFPPEVLILRSKVPTANESSSIVQVLDFNKLEYKDLKEQELLEIESSLKEEDFVVLFNKVLEEFSKPYKERRSPDMVKMTESFYHEQQEEFFCGMHAVNALIGTNAINPTEFRDFLVGYYQKKGVLPKTSEWEPKDFLQKHQGAVDFQLLDPSWGIDLHAVVDFVKFLASQGRVDKKFERLVIRQIKPVLLEGESCLLRSCGKKWVTLTKKFFSKKDRLMVCESNPDHCVSLRRFSDCRYWAVVDSMLKYQEKVKPLTYLKKCFLNCEDPNKTVINILYLKKEA